MTDLYKTIAKKHSQIKCDCEILNPFEIGAKINGPLQMGWTVSRLCNFACPHCFNNSHNKFSGYEASRELIINRICEASPYNVCLCGGEPLTWPDLFDIARKLRNGGIPMVSCVTNGYLADESRLIAMAESGINSIQFSFDGLTSDEHSITRPAKESWARTKKAISIALQRRLFKACAIAWTPTRFNIDNFYDYCLLLIDMGVNSIRLQPLMATGRAKYVYDDFVPTAEQYARLFKNINDININKSGNRRLIEWGDPLEHIWLYTYTPFTPQMISIQSNGWYEISPYIPVLFGNAAETSIQDLWDFGIKRLCQTPIMKRYADQLTTMIGMKSLVPDIYFEEPIMINPFDCDNWALAEKSDDVQALLEFSRKRGYSDIYHLN